MPPLGDLRALVLRALLAAALVAGAAALFALARGEFTDTDAKIIVTSLLFGLASTMAAAGVAARDRRGAARPLGTVTVAATGAAFALLVGGLWADADSETFWRLTGCVGVIALETAHASYVIARARNGGPASARTAGAIAVAAAGLSGVLALIPGSGVADDSDVSDTYLKLVGAVLVVQVVATVVAALARRMGGAPPERPLLAPEDPDAALRRGVLEAADRIERLAADPRVHAECDRLRALARDARD